MSGTPRTSASRREFLQATAAVAATSAVGSVLAIPKGVHAGEEHTIKIALVGCGGRGTGAAANALNTAGPTKLWAMADVFPDRLQSSLQGLTNQFAGKVDVPRERQFIGLDGYRQAIDQLGGSDVVLLATPPAFRPIHLEYAVERGVNVFMEKSFAVDAPGIRRVLAAGEQAAKKNLKVAGGLMWRHDKPREAIIQRLHDGAIGDIHTLRTYRMHGPVGFRPKGPQESDLAHQLRNYSSFTWLNASFLVDWLIHNIDVCCWAKNAWPVAAQGQGGRQVRTEKDQVYDHYAVEYIFADGARLFAQGRHMAGCWGEFADFAQGSRGSARLMENLARSNPRIYSDASLSAEKEVWRYEGPEPDAYQVEHDLLFAAIREDKPYNETERCAKAAMTGILGRMAAHSGQLVTWEEALASQLSLAPNLEQLTWDGPAPVMPDEEGRYAIDLPGITQVF